MADNDAILESTKRSIDRLFSEVSKSAGNAATGLGSVASTANAAAQGLSGVKRASSGLTKTSTAVNESLQRTSSAAGMAAGAFASSSAQIGETFKKLADNVSSHSNTSGGGFLSSLTSMAAGATGAKLTLGAFAKGSGKLSGVMGKLSGVLTKIPTGILGVFGGVGMAAETMITAMADLTAGMDDVGQSGMQFGNSATQYGLAMNKTLLTQEQFNNLLKKNSEALAIFGGTAQGGADRLVQVAGILRDFGQGTTSASGNFTPFIEQLRNMGVSAEEAAEATAAMMSNESMASNMRSMSAREQAAMTVDYVQNLSQLSALTGKSRKALADEQKKLAQNAQFQAAIMKMGPKQQQAVMEGMKQAQALGGDAAAEIFRARVAGVVPQGAEARQLLSLPAGQAVEDMAEAMRVAGENAGEVFNNSLDGIEDAFERTRDQIAPLVAAGLGQFNNTFMALHQTTERFNALQDQLASEEGPFKGMAREAIKVSDAFDYAYRKTMGIKDDPETGEIVVGDAATRTARYFDALYDEVIKNLPQKIGLEGLDKLLNAALEQVEASLPDVGFRVGKEYDGPTDTLVESNATFRAMADTVKETSTVMENFFNDVMGLFSTELPEDSELHKNIMAGRREIPVFGSSKDGSYDELKKSDKDRLLSSAGQGGFTPDEMRSGRIFSRDMSDMVKSGQQLARDQETKSLFETGKIANDQLTEAQTTNRHLSNISDKMDKQVQKADMSWGEQLLNFVKSNNQKGGAIMPFGVDVESNNG